MLTLRSAILLSLGMTLCFGAYHRWQADTGEPINRRAEGWGLLIGIRLSALLLFIVMARWVRDERSLPLGDLGLSNAARWMGVAVLLVAEVWLMWMYRTLGRNITDTVVTRKAAHFVRNGPYAYVRNPMYVGLLFLGCGLGLAISNALPILAGAIIFTLLAIRTKKEESYLLAKFPDQYPRYMQEVGRFWPILRQ